MRSILGAVVLLLAISRASYAEQRKLMYQNDLFDYEWAFDDARISAAQMREAASLAPNSYGATPAGRVLDSEFVIRLEGCVVTSPNTCEEYVRRRGPDAFLAHAARNIQNWNDQMDRLRRQSFPAVLEPAREYVLERMVSAVERERVRYEYLNSGATGRMQQHICRECDCAALDPNLLRQLQAESNANLRMELAAAWQSQAIECESKKHVPAYPVASWESFLKDFGITEERTEGFRDAVPDDISATYDLIFNEARIPASQMRELFWLSPYVQYDPIGPEAGPPLFDQIFIATMLEPNGTYQVEKIIAAPSLESCISLPGTPCEAYNPKVPDAAFLRNAARNLKRADEQVEVLLHMRMPPQLEPVRAYLLEQLLLSVDRERARYEYLTSADATPLRTLLCRECECGADEEALLGKLATEPDPKLRLQLSWYDWHNRLLACERKAHSPTYPLAAWETFLQDFGIKEVGK